MYYRHEPGRMVRLLSAPGAFAVARWGFRAANLVVGAGATYLVDDVIGAARRDTYLRPLFSVKYFPTPWLTLGFDYRNLNYESTGFAVPGYARNVYLFSATARF